MNEVKYNLLPEIMHKNEKQQQTTFKNRNLFIPVALWKPIVLTEFNKQTWDSGLGLPETGGVIDVGN